MWPMRPASRAKRCWRSSCARQRSLIDAYRFSAHPDIRKEIKMVATQPIERKRIKYLEHSRHRANPRSDHGIFEIPKKNITFFHPSFQCGVAYQAPGAYSEVAQANRAVRF